MAKAVFDETTGNESNKPLVTFSASDMRNQFSALFQGDFAPLRARAQSTPDLTVQVNASKIQSFFAPVNRHGAPVVYAGGNTPAIVAPSANPRIDILYLNNANAPAWVTGTEAASPVANWASLSKDAIPIITVYARPTMTSIVNYEDKDSSPNEGYIYEDVRPFLSPLTTNSAVFVRDTQSQTISNLTATIAFDTEEFDEKNEFNLTTNTFTAANNGTYWFLLMLRFNQVLSNFVGTRVWAVNSGGQNILFPIDSGNVDGGAFNDGQGMMFGGLAKLSASDTLHFTFNAGASDTVALIVCHLYIGQNS